MGKPSAAISTPANHGLETSSTFVATAETAALRAPLMAARALSDKGIDAAMSLTYRRVATAKSGLSCQNRFGWHGLPGQVEEVLISSPKVDDLMEALQTHDLNRTHQACDAAITTIQQLA